MLRYLSDAFKALRSGVPASARTEEVTDLVEWLGELVRQVDSSLLDEWEQLTSPDQPHDVPVAVPARPRPLTGNERAFTAMVRNALFRRVELIALRRWYDLGLLDADSGWNAERWEEVVRGYFAEHDSLNTGGDSRGPALLIWDRAEPGVWRVRQILDDPERHHDSGLDVEVDLEASDEAGTPVLRLVEAGRRDAVPAVTHHLASLADIAELRGQLQQADLRTNDLLSLGHPLGLRFRAVGGTRSLPWVRTGPPPAPLPKTNSVCQIKSWLVHLNVTPLGATRGINNIWTKGGLQYAPPIR